MRQFLTVAVATLILAACQHVERQATAATKAIRSPVQAIVDRRAVALTDELQGERDKNRSLRKRIRRLREQTTNLGRMVRRERAEKRWWAQLAKTRARKLHTSSRSTSTVNARSIVSVGRWLQRLGYHVSENPAFGGVCYGCHRGAGHRDGRAIDVNCDGCRGGEQAALDRVVVRLRGLGLFVLWRTDGHWNHLHAETPA